MADKLGVNARSFIEGLNDLGVKARELGIDRVAEAAGVKPLIVKKFIADAMQSKNSDVRKIKAAVASIEAENAQQTH